MSFGSDINVNDRQLVALRRQLDRIEKELQDRGNEDNLDHEPEYAVLFTGSWQSAMPNQLILNTELSGTEKITWQVLRLAITNPGQPGASPRSSELMRHIGCSKPTLTAAKAMLRVTRWATLCSSIRNNQGRFLGDIYLLHDQPLSLAANLQLDSEYLRFLENIIMSEKKRKRLRTAAASILQSVRDDELMPCQMTELERGVSNLSMFKESETGFPVYQESDQKVTQVKKLNPVNTSELARNEQESPQATGSIDQVKKLNPDERGGLKNFLTASSSSINNKINNNIYYAHAREKDIPQAVNQDVGASVASNVPMIGSVLANLFKEVFVAREATVPVLMTKLKPLSRRQQVNVLCQLLGRLIQADKNEAKEVRDVVRYCHSLITAEKENQLMLDEYAQRIKEAVEDDMPLVI